jgi:hypothetical protein
MKEALFQTIVGGSYNPPMTLEEINRTPPVSPIMNGVTPNTPSEADQPITENPVTTPS